MLEEIGGKEGRRTASTAEHIAVDAGKERMIQLTFREDGLATEETRATIILGDAEDVIRALQGEIRGKRGVSVQSSHALVLVLHQTGVIACKQRSNYTICSVYDHLSPRL